MIRDKYKSWGIDARPRDFESCFPTPTERVLEMTEPARFADAEKPAIRKTRTPATRINCRPITLFDRRHVSGQLVYVNYGVPADYDDSPSLASTSRFKIVISVTGEAGAASSPRRAEHGAIGCLIYPTPQR